MQRRTVLLSAAGVAAAAAGYAAFNSLSKGSKGSVGPVDPNRGLVLPRAHGFAVDHFAIAVPDAREGVDYVAERIGVRPDLHNVRPGQYHQSASLPLGPDSFMEIIGPAPGYRGLHPLPAFMRRLKEPTLLFWYVATDDLEMFSRRVAAAGAKVERVEHVGEAEDDGRSYFTRAVIGPGFMTQRPSAIEWKRQSERLVGAGCSLADFSLTHPDAAYFNRLFTELGVGLTVAEGPSRIAATLDTPNGLVTFENAGYELSGLDFMVTMLRGLFQSKR